MENQPKKIKLESENDFVNSSESQQENFLRVQKVKKDPEGNFLFLPFKSPKMPKSIKREVTRKEIKCSRTSKFSKHQCKICQKYLYDEKSLKNHTELHFQPSSFDCKKCEKVFIRKGYFDVHKCVKKSGRHFCNFCEKNYTHDGGLYTHMKKAHADKLQLELFACDFCDEKFITKGYLKIHLESFQCRKIFTCDHCGKELRYRSRLCQHLQTHLKLKVECKICHVQVKKTSLNTHIKFMHESEEVECEICKKVFKNLKALKVHLQSHEVKKFACQMCELKFTTRGHLNYHMKFHKNPEQFKCQICEHQSKAKGELKKHFKTHDKNREKNLKCDFRTYRQQNMKVHLKFHQKLAEN
jgi:KRAB domain-containing zinc finger protein